MQQPNSGLSIRFNENKQLPIAAASYDMCYVIISISLFALLHHSAYELKVCSLCSFFKIDSIVVHHRACKTSAASLSPNNNLRTRLPALMCVGAYRSKCEWKKKKLDNEFHKIFCVNCFVQSPSRCLMSLDFVFIFFFSPRRSFGNKLSLYLPDGWAMSQWVCGAERRMWNIQVLHYTFSSNHTVVLITPKNFAISHNFKYVQCNWIHLILIRWILRWPFWEHHSASIYIERQYVQKFEKKKIQFRLGVLSAYNAQVLTGVARSENRRKKIIIIIMWINNTIFLGCFSLKRSHCVQRAHTDGTYCINV